MSPLHILTIIGRVLAFAFGCVAFYLAFFLYEEEDGVPQNRLDNMWKAIRKRAKETDTVWTALINKSTQVLLSLSDRMFGKSLLSLQMITVSMNLSLVAIAFSPFVATAMFTGLLSHFSAEIYASSGILSALLLSNVLLAVRFPRRWVSILTLVPIAGFCLMAFVASWIFLGGAHYDDPASKHLGVPEGVVSALLISLFVDVAVIAYMRRVFKSISVRSTIAPILGSVVVLVTIGTAVVGTPFYILVTPNLLWDSDLVRMFVLMTGIMNTTAVIYCLIPAVVFISLLLHRALWPILSRALSPFYRYKILNNQKALVAVGCLAWSFAFNLEHVGAKELLKLLS